MAHNLLEKPTDAKIIKIHNSVSTAQAQVRVLRHQLTACLLRRLKILFCVIS